MRYRNSNNNKKNGVIYTPSDMANFVSEELLYYNSTKNKKKISILDPAVGDGELLIAIIRNILKENDKIILNVIGYEINSQISFYTNLKLREMFPNISIEIRNKDFIEAICYEKIEKFDYVIANPPYVRTQILGEKRSKKLSTLFNLKGEIDLYYIFLICIKKVLKRNGIAGFITSNKFITIKSGKSVRKFILENYKLHRIIDLGDTKLFNAAVLPCLLFFSNGITEIKSNVPFSSVYLSNEKKAISSNENIFKLLDIRNKEFFNNQDFYYFKHGKLSIENKEFLWSLETDEDKKWLENIEINKFCTFEEIGKIRVGIKTTADNVFIGNHWKDDLNKIELLKPLITHRDAGQIKSKRNENWKVLYTHEVKNGKKCAVDLKNYPQSKKYLEKYYNQLNSRDYLKKAKRNWYEIWVPQNPKSWKNIKIIFRDISKKPEFWLDTSGAIVNGDCYWIDINNNISKDLIYLTLAVANSSFIEKYYDLKFNTKLYSGKRRYQTQYVKNFPIPKPSTKRAKYVINLVKKIIAEDEEKKIQSYKREIDNIIETLFNQKSY